MSGPTEQRPAPSASAPPEDPPRDVVPVPSAPLRALFTSLGLAWVGLGALGVVLPGLPTTPFMLLAAWMFSKSSPRFHAWLWNHRVFGPYVRGWARHRVIPLSAKLLSSGVMLTGMALMLARGASPWIWAPTLLVCLFGAGFIWRCPSHAPNRDSPSEAFEG